MIGSHCSLSSCRDLDLLPIRCRCDHLFCRHHIPPESHDCPIDPAANNPAPELPFQKLERCAADKCHKPSLASFITSASDETSRSSATCPRCQKAFCARQVISFWIPSIDSELSTSHRYPQSHSCSVSAPALPSKNSTAGQALLAKHFPQTSRSATSTSAPHVPSDPKKRAQLLKVQLMKMRHHAIPGDLKDKLSFVLVDQRLHVKVKLEDPKHQYKEGIFWFRKVKMFIFLSC